MGTGKKNRKKVKASAGGAIPAPEVADRAPISWRDSNTSLTRLVPVRFDPGVYDRILARARAEDRSVSGWIRRTVEQELARSDS